MHKTWKYWGGRYAYKQNNCTIAQNNGSKNELSNYPKTTHKRIKFYHLLNYGIIYFVVQKGIDYQCFMIHIDGVI